MSRPTCTRWAFDLSTWTPTLPQLAQAVAAVQPEERTRLMKFYFINDFLSSLVGRLLMRKFVSTHSALDYHAVQFARDARGKPYWVAPVEATPGRLSFNVSHQGDFVLLAGVVAHDAAEDFGVGVDVMKIEYSGGKPLSEFFRLMRNKFSANEWRYIARTQHNELDQLKAFMRHWCLKEAYVKELGVGITIDLQEISFTVDATAELSVDSQPLSSTTLSCNGLPMSNWHFEEHLLNAEYCAALAFKNCAPATDKFQLLQIDDLLVNSAKSEQAHMLDYCKQALSKETRS